MYPNDVSPELFECIESGDLEDFNDRFYFEELSDFLPILARGFIAKDKNVTTDDPSFAIRKKVWFDEFLPELLSRTSLLLITSVNYEMLEADAKKEMQLRQKLGNREQDSILAQSLTKGLALEFEQSNGIRKMRLVLSEVLFTMSQMHDPKHDYYIKTSEMFDNWVYLNDVCICLVYILLEIPNLFSVSDLCETLLHFNNGPYIITRIVANMPESFLEVCYHLISNGEKVEEDSEGGLIRLEALKKLCKMNPRHNLTIRSKCVELGKMLCLSIHLSINDKIESNLIPFLSGLLIGNDQQTKLWLSNFIRNAQKKKSDSNNCLTTMRHALWQYVDRIKELTKETGTLPQSEVVLASVFLKLICTFKGVGSFKFTDEEAADLVYFVTLKVPNSPVGYRFITLGLCTIVTCPMLVAHTDLEKSIIEWVKSLMKNDVALSSTEVEVSYGEILLLMAIHFHSQQLNAISDLVCTTLGVKVVIRSTAISKIRQIFVTDIFAEQVIATHAVKVKITQNLSSEINGFLPVHCIYQLIKSRAFTKHKVPIKDWIYRQVLASKFPIHPVLPALLEVYTESILIPGTGLVGNPKNLQPNEPFTDEEILRVFKGFEDKNKELGPPLLLLYYLLLYEDLRLLNCRNLEQIGRKVLIYPNKLFAQIPIKYLLQEAQKNQVKCGGLFPSLLRLLTTHFPQLCTMNEWLEENVTTTPNDYISDDFPSDKIEINPNDFKKAFAESEQKPGEAIKLLKICKGLSPHKRWTYSRQIVGEIKVIMKEGVSRKIQDMYRDVWFLLNNIYPRNLWEITINSLQPDGALPLTVDDLTIDPTHVLRCDPKVFRCAPILEILLHIMSATLAASRYFLSKHQQQNILTTTDYSEIEREEMKGALIAMQESATVQILLEACLPNDEDSDGIAHQLCLKEIQSVICSFIHQMFISDPTLAKLVHFQGYCLELLPITVQGIPSIHICLDFLPELLGQPEVEKQIFGIQLISHLSIQYSIPKSYNIAVIALRIMTKMSTEIISEDREDFFLPILSSLERFCKAFPPLIPDIVLFLKNLAKISNAQNSVEPKELDPQINSSRLIRQIEDIFLSITNTVMLEGKLY